MYLTLTPYSCKRFKLPNHWKSLEEFFSIDHNEVIYYSNQPDEKNQPIRHFGFISN